MDKDLLSILDLSTADLERLFSLTDRLKKNRKQFARSLSGKTLALIFQKPSNRTRVSFEVGMNQMGGHSIYLAPHEINLGVRESIKDVAKTLSRYIDGVVLRTFAHDNVREMARHACVPVINGLSDFSHPCQALADLYTVREQFKEISGRTLAYIGDGNNVCNSLLFICSKLGVNINVATPRGFEPQAHVVDEARRLAAKTKARVSIFNVVSSAAEAADVIYTDVWTSMGQETEAESRRRAFAAFQINRALLQRAKKHVLIMHCLPAHRGEEITDEVIDSVHSVVFDQAENRLHVQKAVLLELLKKNGAQGGNVCRVQRKAHS